MRPPSHRPPAKFVTATKRPAHQVDIAYPLAFGRYTVTVAEYAAFTPENARQPAAGASWPAAIDRRVGFRVACSLSG